MKLWKFVDVYFCNKDGPIDRLFRAFIASGDTQDQASTAILVSLRKHHSDETIEFRDCDYDVEEVSDAPSVSLFPSCDTPTLFLPNITCLPVTLRHPNSEPVTPVTPVTPSILNSTPLSFSP